MLARVSRKVLVRIGVVLFKLFDNILTRVGVVLLDLLSYTALVLGWNGSSLSTVTEQLKDEIGDIASSNGDMLDRRANNVAFGDGNGVFCQWVPG